MKWLSAYRSSGIGKILAGVVFVVVVTSLMLWLLGAFRTVVRPVAPAKGQQEVPVAEVVKVRHIPLPRVETSVGTIQPVHRVELASRILARILEVNVVAGQRVDQGQTLVRLDDADLAARVKQAKAALDEATATRDQARIEAERIQGLIEQNSASRIELDRALAEWKTAEAAVARTKEALDEARTVLSYAMITSPITGMVVDKRVNVGDMAVPGQVLVTLLDPSRMQLVAIVRESLSRRLKVGDSIDVRVDVLDHACRGVISEIVPETDPSSRSFSVKVTGPCPPGVYAGMFGRLLIPLDTEQILVIPQAAVVTVGQLQLVRVRTPEGDERRAIRVGRKLGDQVEVLAGLSPDELVVLQGPSPQ